jgi:hypothetical protein
VTCLAATGSKLGKDGKTAQAITNTFFARFTQVRHLGPSFSSNS